MKIYFSSKFVLIDPLMETYYATSKNVFLFFLLPKAFIAKNKTWGKMV
jgi:hypothetical protein